MHAASNLTERLRRVVKMLGGARSVGRVSGVGSDTVKRYLVGKGRPSVSFLTTIARQAGVRLDWLLTGEGPVDRADEEGQAGRISSLEARVAQLEEALAAPMLEIRTTVRADQWEEIEKLKRALAPRAPREPA